VIRNFGNKAAQEIWENEESKSLPKDLWIRAKALLTIMHGTREMKDLKINGQPPNIRLHKLKGARADEWSVTIRLSWCVSFCFRNGEFLNVKIEDYHKG
jgi:proteic killer suppression protein